MKYSLLAVAVLALPILADDHSGMVPLRSVVKSSTTITVTPTALAGNLDIDGNASAGPIATVVEKSNSVYSVDLRSDNYADEFQSQSNVALTKQFFLRQSATSGAPVGGTNTMGERINYTLTYDGKNVVPADATVAGGLNLTGAGTSITSAVNATGNSGITKSLNIVIQPNQAYSAGVYTDTLTLTITPDTTTI